MKPPSPPLRQNSLPTDTQQSVFSSVQQEMAVRRQKASLARQDSRLSVKSLIESIENATKQAKAGPGSRSSSTSSLNSITSDGRSIGTGSVIGNSNLGSAAMSPTSPIRHQDWADSVIKCPLREQQANAKTQRGNNKNIINGNLKTLFGHFIYLNCLLVSVTS